MVKPKKTTVIECRLSDTKKSVSARDKKKSKKNFDHLIIYSDFGRFLYQHFKKERFAVTNHKPKHMFEVQKVEIDVNEDYFGSVKGLLSNCRTVEICEFAIEEYFGYIPKHLYFYKIL